MKVLAVMLVFFSAIFADPLSVRAVEKNGESLMKETENRIRSNEVFLKAARQIVEASSGKAWETIIKMAEKYHTEGIAHYNLKEYEFALEDINESTQTAIHAIILTKNSEDAEIRSIVIQEEMVLKEKHDKERKEVIIRKGIDEVEIFIRTAERLLQGNKNPEAERELDNAREAFKAAKLSLAGGQLDESISGLNKAYKLATQTVKGIKRAQGDIITFPKPAFSDEKQMLDYELKKNDSYVFFASQSVKEKNPVALKLLNAAKAAREDASKHIEAGDAPKATELLKTSTGLFIDAIKASSERQ
ncbi:MAG: hypothetical protein AABY51_10285 [Deltaproteobacteria bacterium]